MREAAPELQLVCQASTEGDAGELDDLFSGDDESEEAQQLELPVTAVVVSLAYAGTISRLADMIRTLFRVMWQGWGRGLEEDHSARASVCGPYLCAHRRRRMSLAGRQRLLPTQQHQRCGNASCGR